MILRLVRTQLRSEWKQTALGVGTLSLALATFSLLVAATKLANWDRWESHTGPCQASGVNYGYVVAVHDDPASHPILGQVEPVLSLEDAEKLVRDAAVISPVEATAHVATHQTVDVNVPLAGSLAERYLATGDEPGPGEIALSPHLASDLGLDLGDTITLESFSFHGDSTTSVSLTVSGILLNGSVDSYQVWVPDAIASTDDFRILSESFPHEYFADPETDVAALATFIDFTWEGHNPALAPYQVICDYNLDTSFTWGSVVDMLSSDSLKGPASWALAVSAIAMVCLILAALFMGRAQAEARTRWNATAMTLGASGRTIAAASLVETAMISVLGIAAGLGAGIGLANLHLVLLRATHPASVLPPSISVPALVLVVGAGVGLGLAAILAVVPAFWVSRVPPAAALKPVTPVSEATLSRPVHWWWPAALTAVGVGVAGVAVVMGTGSAGVQATSMASAAILIAAVPALVIQSARGLVSLAGRALARSRRPWVLAAGDGILAHRRAFTFASLSALLTGGIASWGITVNAANEPFPRSSPLSPWNPLETLYDWWKNQFSSVDESVLLVICSIAFAVVAIVSATVLASFRESMAKDDSVRGALGLSRRGERLSVGTRQTSVLAIGSVAGALGGCVIAILHRLLLAVLSSSHLVNSLEWNLGLMGDAFIRAAIVVAIGVALAVMGGLLASLVAGPFTSSSK